MAFAVLCGSGLAFTGAPAMAQESSRFFNGDREHRKLLAQRIDETLRAQVAAEVVGTADAGLAGLGIAAGAWMWAHDRPLAVTYVVGFGLVDGVVVSSLFLTRDARSSVLEGVMFAAPMVASLGLAVADDPAPFPRLTTGSLAAGYAAAGTLTIINRALTPTRYSVLRAHRGRLEEVERDPSAQERRRMHQALLGARGPVPRWLIGLPLLIAGGWAAAPAFDDGYSKNERLIAGIGGGLGLLTGLLYFFPNPVDRYESDLKTLDISLAGTPGGVALAGTF